MNAREKHKTEHVVRGPTITEEAIFIFMFIKSIYNYLYVFSDSLKINSRLAWKVLIFFGNYGRLQEKGTRNVKVRVTIAGICFIRAPCGDWKMLLIFRQLEIQLITFNARASLVSNEHCS